MKQKWDKVRYDISLEGFEPMFHIYKTGERCESHTTIGLFRPIRIIRKHIYNWNIKRYLKKSRYPLIKCEGCGEGLSEWLIFDPNGRKDDDGNLVKLKVCDHCVFFYDVFMTKKRLEFQWDYEAERGIQN